MKDEEKTLKSPVTDRERDTAAREIGIALTAVFALAAAILFTAALFTAGLSALLSGGGLFPSPVPAAAWLNAAGRDLLPDDGMPDENTPADEYPDDAPSDTPGTDAPADGINIITMRDFSVAAVPTVKNKTSYQLDTEALLAMPTDTETPREIYAAYGKTAPIVLIIHTHGTECYRAESQTESREGDHFRSDDPLQNIVAVGDVLAEVQDDCGYELTGYSLLLHGRCGNCRK